MIEKQLIDWHVVDRVRQSDTAEIASIFDIHVFVLSFICQLFRMGTMILIIASQVQMDQEECCIR